MYISITFSAGMTNGSVGELWGETLTAHQKKHYRFLGLVGISRTLDDDT